MPAAPQDAPTTKPAFLARRSLLPLPLLLVERLLAGREAVDAQNVAWLIDSANITCRRPTTTRSWPVKTVGAPSAEGTIPAGPYGT